MNDADADEAGGTEEQRTATPETAERMPAAEAMLRAMSAYGVTYVFGNFGTDHTPLLEAASRLREEGDADAFPEFVTCPHEGVALSAAHGYAAATGEAQAVIVHVDVGTQNLGSMVHNAHRGSAPVFIFAGLAPVSYGDDPGARNTPVHFLQNVFDQEGILREFCRWSDEYRPPADPDEYVARALEMATTPRRGPTYMTATREALETPVDVDVGSRSAEGVGPTGADDATLDHLASLIEEADAPVVVTSKLGVGEPRESVETLVDFAEAAGAGVVEASPAALCFPRTHDLHAGFATEPAFERADLALLADTDVPWVPETDSAPPADLSVIQVDVDPAKPEYPQWDLRVDQAVRADPTTTLRALTGRLDGDADGRETWGDLGPFAGRRERRDRAADHREAGRLTPTVLSDAIDGVVDEDTVVVNETTTNNRAVLEGIALDRPGSYLYSHGSGLGWAPGAAVGAKLAHPDSLVVSLVGDGSYVFGHPTAAAWAAGAHDAPTLTVVYNNSGWNAVKGATLREHPDGDAATTDVPESKFSPALDLSHAANVVDAHTEAVESPGRLDDALSAAVDAVASGKPAVLDVRIEPI